MMRWLACVVLVGGALPASLPAAAFWERSQWRRCSEGPTPAEYRRWRCWELDGGSLGPGLGPLNDGRSNALREDTWPLDGWPQRQPVRPGRPVQRLG